MSGRPKAGGRGHPSRLMQRRSGSSPAPDDPLLLRKRIPGSVMERLSSYEKALRSLEEKGVRTASAEEIGGKSGHSPSQVGKDLAYLEESALRAKSLPVKGLRESLKKILEPKTKIPEATINRLSTYSRILNRLGEEGSRVVSSAELAQRCGLNPAKIRKDLAYFGEFGVRGKGYYVDELKENLKRILGVTSIWKVVLVGAGNLGTALLAYRGFLAHGFTIEAVFDKFPENVPPLKPGSPPVMPMSELSRVIAEKGIRIGIVAVPGESTQEVVNLLVGAGVTGILNFAPTQISAPPHVKVINVELGSELEHLAYYVSKELGGRAR